MKQETERLKAEIAELTSRAAQVDAQEDAEYGPDNRGDEIPEELRRREQRLGKIQEAIERLRSRQAEEDRAEGRKPEPPSAEPVKKVQIRSSWNSLLAWLREVESFDSLLTCSA